MALAHSNAQTKGYLGRQFNISVGLKGMPGTGKMFYDESLIDINLRYSTRIEYIMKKNFSMGINLEGVTDRINITNWAISQYSPYSYYQQSHSSTPLEQFTSKAYYRGYSYSLFMKFYFKQNYLSLAPIGRYIMFALDWNKNTVSDDGRYYNLDHPVELISYKSNTFYFGWGIQTILYKYMTFDLFMGFGINGFGLDYYSSSNPLLYTAGKLYADNILMIKFNVGWMLF